MQIIGCYSVEFRIIPDRLRCRRGIEDSIPSQQRTQDILSLIASCGRIFLATALLLFGSQPALAIPSPELVVGSLTSLSQLAAIGSALLGGGAVAIGARSRSAAAPALKRLALIFGGLAVLFFGLNVYQWKTHQAAERARLEATLLRPTAKGEHGATLDPLLREIPYRKQLTHPLGLQTGAAAEIVQQVESGAETPWVILDIRETAETEMGTFKNAKKIRFPDISSTAIDLSAKKALLICHNGNRSAETCAALAAKGIDCRFIIGGLEKWITEERRIGDGPVRGLGEIRAIPDYRNHGVLLDTAAARALVDRDGAVFVDVRYPGEFAAGHLPDAVNLPIRPTPTSTLTEKIGALPRKPIVAPCYDRRSCFFAEILGLEITRAGGDFRGRYTTPWEFFTPSKTPPYVAAYLAERNKGVWQYLRDTVQGGLAAGRDAIGLPLALLLLALLSRLLVLPFSLKAERDQVITHEIANEMARIKAATAGDGQRQGRAIRALYRTHGLTPGRNLIALLFLPVLALSVDAAQQVAQTEAATFLWMETLAERDPLFLLPAAFSFLLCAYVDWALVTTARQRLFVWLGLAPLLFVAGALLPAAADLYVIFSGILLLVQRALVMRLPQRLMSAIRTWWRTRRDAGLRQRGIVSLNHRCALLAAGNKAYRLALMREAGLPVPDGYVLSDTFLKRWPELSERERRAVLRSVARRLGGRRFAVRSSGRGEDAADASFAGVFESVIDVDRRGLMAAVDTVLASFSAARVASYGLHGAGCNILIQPLIDAAYAGVLFTRAPDAPGAMLIEAVEGSGEALVSGRATPYSFKAGRISGTIFDGKAPDIAIEPLLRLARDIEGLFDAPQDIEWAYAKGAFHILQARDITTIAKNDVTFNAWQRLSDAARGRTADDIVFQQTPMSELLPRPTPASLSLLNDLWVSGGSADLAMRVLGFNAAFPENGQPLYIDVQGLLYADAVEERARHPEMTRLAVRRVRKSAARLAADLEAHWAPEVTAHARLLDAADYQRLSLDRLVTLIGEMRQRFVMQTYVDAEMINIAAQIFADDMRQAFEAEGRDPLAYLDSSHETRLARALSEARTLDGAARDDALAAAIGHRAHFDYELSEPRFGENPAALAELANTMMHSVKPRQAARGAAAMTPLPRHLADILARAQQFEMLKEDAKHLALQELAHLRYALKAAGAAAQMGDAIFFLSLDEVTTLDAATMSDLGRVARKRRAARETLLSLPAPPATLTVDAIERGPHATAQTPDAYGAVSGGALSGARVSGRDAVRGRARVIRREDAETGQPIANFAPGDILVAPMLHPAWLPELVIAGGAVSEIGGWLSHMAIVARERGVAMITGVKGLSVIRDGDEITLESDGRITVHATTPLQAMAAE